MLSLSNFAFNLLLYFTIVYYLLDADHDLTSKFFKVLPMDKNTRRGIANTFKDSVKGVFLSSFLIALY